jgi:hypothetical protein
MAGGDPSADADSALELGVRMEVNVHVDAEHPRTAPTTILPSTRFELESKSDDGDHKAY